MIVGHQMDLQKQRNTRQHVSDTRGGTGQDEQQHSGESGKASGKSSWELPAWWEKQAWSVCRSPSSLVTGKPASFFLPRFFHIFGKAILSHDQLLHQRLPICSHGYGQFMSLCPSSPLFYLSAVRHLHVNYTSHIGSGSSFISLGYICFCNAASLGDGDDFNVNLLFLSFFPKYSIKLQWLSARADVCVKITISIPSSITL